MPSEKAADEIYCSRCGSTIKKGAEICPECGARNPEQEKPTTGGGSLSTRSVETEPSDNWWYGVALGVVLWITVALTILTAQSSARSGDWGAAIGSSLFIFPFQMLGWLVFALSLHYDAKYGDSVAEYGMDQTMYVLAAALLPIFTQIFAVVSFAVGGAVSLAIAIVVPLVLVWMGVNHIRHRNEVLTPARYPFPGGRPAHSCHGATVGEEQALSLAGRS